MQANVSDGARALCAAILVTIALGHCGSLPEARAQTTRDAGTMRVWATNVLTGVDHGLDDAARGGAGRPPSFFPATSFDPQIPAPAEFLGFPVGARPATHAEVMAYFSAVADASPAVQFYPYGTSHEGRVLFAALVSSSEQLAQLDQIRGQLARLADPRQDAAPEIGQLPLCVYAGAGVHGDETSGTDAALELLYYLAAGETPEAARLRERLLILLDPLQNPDGRDRVIAQWRSLAGRVPDDDDQSLRHEGVWPGGRTNHYLFDLNRDWFLATQPESQGRLRMITAWNPQLLIDAHEMGSQNTFLFSPPREPFNPMITEHHRHWWRIFAGDQAAAFDRHGWEYYTREWHEEWFPGFASSWANGIGAIGILYEQAGVEGSRVARRDGRLLTYRETVHHQLVSFLANLQTAAEQHDALMRSFREERERRLRDAAGAYVVLPTAHTARTDFLLRGLLAQGIEVYRATAEVAVGRLQPYWMDTPAQIDRLPPGSCFIPLRQPYGGLIETILAFDPRMDEEFLRSERLELERLRRSRLYDASAWSVAMASGLPVYHSSEMPTRHLERVTLLPPRQGSVIQPDAGFGFLIDGTDDRCLHALVRLWEAGLRVHAALEPFTVEGRAYSRGTLLVKRALQAGRWAARVPRDEEADAGEPTLIAVLQRVAAESGVTLVGVGTALSDEGPDLGGERFRLLREPRVAVLTGNVVSWGGYGAITWLLDHELGLPTVPLWVTELTHCDLSRYNVVVIPSFWGGPESGRRVIGPPELERLRAWVRDGGTLVAVGASAAHLADSTSDFGSVRLRRQVLDRLAARTAQAEHRRGDLRPEDFHAAELHWAIAPGPMDGLIGDGVAALAYPEPFWSWSVGKSSEELRREDERLRLFHPRGAILRVNLDAESWLTAGVAVPAEGREWMPAPCYAEHVLVAEDPREAVATFAGEDSLRLSGLLWPEARERWARSAYLTRETIGMGQLILFADQPCHRGAYRAPQRAFLNAVLAGPGLGSRDVDAK